MKRELKPGFIASIEALCERPGGDVLCGLVNSLQEDEPEVAVRINAAKTDLQPQGKRLVPWALNGFYIDGARPRFTFDPALHQGLYYVQDPSSMVIERIVKALAGDTPVVYVDSCAAPGGKTTATMNVLPEGSLVIANEFDRRRADALVENIIKWGYPDVVVTNDDTSKFRKLGAIADIVAADVPCSGEGMMRKEEAAVEQWSPALVEQCASLQRAIIDNMWSALKPGGYFIYSTCTFNHVENEENVAYLVDEYGAIPVDVFALIGAEWVESGIKRAVDSPYPAARFIPGVIAGEGLFVAVLQKPGASVPGASAAGRSGNKKSKKESRVKGVEFENIVSNWITGEGKSVEVNDDKIYAISSFWSPLIKEIRRNMNILYSGVEIGNIKGRDVLPSQALALSPILNCDAFHRADVDYRTALQYLSRQTITLADAPKGIVLLTYRGYPLGFVKNLGNRANNLYPSPWAIRSTHLPDVAPVIL